MSSTQDAVAAGASPGLSGAGLPRSLDPSEPRLPASLARLFPAPARLERRRGSRACSDADVAMELLLLPTGRRPRLLVPATPGAARSRALRTYAEGAAGSSRWLRSAVRLTAATPLPLLLLRDRLVVRHPSGATATNTLAGRLRELLGEDVVFGIRPGSARANAKPVLQVLARDGRQLAYVKVGHNALTRELVASEAEALRGLEETSLHYVEVPKVLGLMPFAGLDLLLLSPLEVPLGGPAASVPFAAMADVARSSGTYRCPLLQAPFWRVLEETREQLADAPGGAVLARVATGLARRAGEVELEIGSWHGDWTAWNMAATAGRVLVWDWERYEEGVPVGFDALHYTLHSMLVGGKRRDAAGARLLSRSDTVLAAMNVPASLRSLTVDLYLLAIATRYVRDAAGAEGRPVRPLAEWTVSFLQARTDGH